MWSHELMYKLWVEDPAPIIEAIRGYVATDYDFPSNLAAVRDDLEAAKSEVVQGIDGEARAKLDAALQLSLAMNPLTPDHHFYVDQGTNARLRAGGDRDRPQARRRRHARRPRGGRLPALQRAASPDGGPRRVRRPGARLRSPRRARGGLRAATAGVAGHRHQVGDRVPLRRAVGLPGPLLRRRAGDHRRDQGPGRLPRAWSRGPRATSRRSRSSTRYRRATSSSAA